MPKTPRQIPKRPTIAWYKRELKAAGVFAATAEANHLAYVAALRGQLTEQMNAILAQREQIARLPTSGRLEALVKEMRTHSALARRLHAVATRKESGAGAGVTAVAWERAADLLEALLNEFNPPNTGLAEGAGAGSPGSQYKHLDFKHPAK